MLTIALISFSNFSIFVKIIVVFCGLTVVCSLFTIDIYTSKCMSTRNTYCSSLQYNSCLLTEKLIRLDRMFKQFQQLEVITMTKNTHEKEVSERLERIEETLARLSDRMDNMFRGMREMKAHFGTSRKDSPTKPVRPSRHGFHGDLTPGQQKKPSNPWALKSIESSWQDRSISIDLKILASPDTLLPTLRALKSNPNGLTAEEVGRITKRNRSTEANYLSKMFMLGFVDKVKSGRNAKYKYSDRWLPPYIEDQI